MTDAEKYVIVSEDYADFIVDYRYNPLVLEEFENAVVHIMNEIYAVMHTPVPLNTDRLVYEFGYSVIPKLYGLVSKVSLAASGVNTVRNLPNFMLSGNGVLIGIIDTGIDYRNPAFIKNTGATKIVSIWDQTIQSDSAYPFETFFGTEYAAEQINLALYAENPLEIVPSMDVNGHGTMMAGVAAGTENIAAGFEGVAPGAELVVVKLRQAKQYLKNFFLIPEGVECYQENDIMWGLQYCIQVARLLNRPIVLCLGLGTSLTAHTGETNLGNFMSILGDYTRVGVVTAAGNEGNMGRHFFAASTPEVEFVPVELNVGQDENSFSMELWGDLPGIYSVDILSPSGEYINRIVATTQISRKVSFIFENTVINIDYQLTESLTGKQLILFRFQNPYPGTWRFNVYARGNLPTSFHIWLPMGNFITNTTYFLQPNIYTTLLSPGNSINPITVTAYNALNGSLYANASRGYTNDSAVKPDLAAPGVNYIAPAITGEFTQFTGTGVASAHAAGIVALFLEWAVIYRNFPSVDTTVIKNYLIRGARRETYLTYPNRDWGYGRIDIYQTFNILRGE